MSKLGRLLTCEQLRRYLDTLCAQGNGDCEIVVSEEGKEVLWGVTDVTTLTRLPNGITLSENEDDGEIVLVLV